MPRRFAADAMLYPIGAPIIVAHRGGAGECPENIAETFLTMDEQDFRYLETDAHTTFDGVAVLCHDATLNRTAGAAGKVRGYTWRELVRVRGGRPVVLRMDEALERHPDAVFSIDAKSDDITAPLARAIHEVGAQSGVHVVSSSERRLRRMRGELPETTSSLGIGAITRIVAASWTKTGAARRCLLKGLPDAQVAQAPLSFHGVPVLIKRFVASAHEARIAVHAWAVDDVDATARLLDMGVDGIITDVPAAMYGGLRERGLPVSRS